MYMTLIQLDRSQNHQQQKNSPIPLQSAIDSLDNRAKFPEFLDDSQLEGGQRIVPIKIAETLSRILEDYWLERRWFI